MSKLAISHLLIVLAFCAAVFTANAFSASNTASDSDPYWTPTSTRPLIP